jgi:hypothetical protein
VILARNCCAHHSSKSMGTKSVGRAEGWTVILPSRLVGVSDLKLTTSLAPSIAGTGKKWVGLRSPLPNSLNWWGPVQDQRG